MKVDKDAILKQKFWILVGVFALLWLMSLSVLWVYAGTPAAKAKTDYDDAKTKVAKYPRPKNDSFLPPWNDYAKLFRKQKDDIWKIAWEGDKKSPEGAAAGETPWQGQAGMYTWPTTESGGGPGSHPLNSLLLYPDSPFSSEHREWYKGKDAYLKQFDDLYWGELKTPPPPQKIDPANTPPGDRPLDPVTFKGDYYGIMKRVDFDSSTKAPDAEECWLAQEDFWVKREVLYAVRDALTAACRMEPVKADPNDKPDAKYLGRQTFRNDSWEVTLLFDRTDRGVRISPDSTIKNVHVSRRDQNLSTPVTPGGAWFRLRQGGGAPFLIAFEGERVAWEQTRVMGAGKWRDGWYVGVEPSQDMVLEQVFDVTSTPVVSIDEIAIPKVSHHNANRPLLPTKPERYGHVAADTKTPGPGAPANPLGPAPIPGGTPGGTPGGFGSPLGTGSQGSAAGPPGGLNNPLGGPSGGQTVGNPTANKFFDRNRYLFVTDQSRHLPLAMTVTVDQSHLHELLVAFANSRLRFQTTQVEFRRVLSGGSTATSPGSAATPAFTPPAGGSTGFGSSAGPPGGFQSQPAAASAPAAQPANPNLVELTIYGIASLYERPRPAAP